MERVYDTVNYLPVRFPQTSKPVLQLMGSTGEWTKCEGQ